MEKERRRAVDRLVSHAAFMSYKEATDAHRCNMHKRMNEIHLAIFAKDSDNPNGQPGVMITMQKLDAHIDNVCAVARWGWKILLGIGTLLVMVNQMGWL